MDIFAPDKVMVVLTWVTFLSLLTLLKKFAWGPILVNLQKREDEIRDSLAKADEIKVQLANVDQQKQVILEDAKTQAAKIIQEARLTAGDAAAGIEQKARQHAKDILDSAKAQIAGERQRVTQDLKKETIDTAILLAEKILEENLDREKNKHLIEKAIGKDLSA